MSARVIGTTGVKQLAAAWAAACIIAGCGATPPDGTADAASNASADAATASVSDAQASAQSSFWAALQSLCGSAHAGQVVQGAPGDTAFMGKELIMHTRDCSDDAVHIAFNAGEDRSRTWVITRTADGLRLKHDHRHEDGSEDAITQYGGDTRTAGTARTQEFYADAHTTELIPAAATNVWTVEVVPDSMYGYALRREGTDRRFRVEFDLTRDVEAPPPSWGH